MTIAVDAGINTRSHVHGNVLLGYREPLGMALVWGGARSITNGIGVGRILIFKTQESGLNIFARGETWLILPLRLELHLRRFEDHTYHGVGLGMLFAIPLIVEIDKRKEDGTLSFAVGASLEPFSIWRF